MYSLEHKNFLKKIKRKNLFIKVCQVTVLLLFLVFWQIMVDFKIVDSFIFSSPKLVVKTIVDLYKNGNLLGHIWVTVYEVFISFLIGTGLGCLIAGLLWWNKTIQKIVEPYLTVINSLPKVALGPIIIIWFGAGMKSIIFMALLISLVITIINVYEGFSSVDKNQLKLMNTFRASKVQIFFKLIVPSNYKTIVSSLKINVSMSLIGVIMGEFLVSKKGIGYLILYGSQIFNLNLVISGIFVLCIVATIMYVVVSFVEKKLVRC